MKKIFGRKDSKKEKKSGKNKIENNTNVSSSVVPSDVSFPSPSGSTLSTTYSIAKEERVVTEFVSQTSFRRTIISSTQSSPVLSDNFPRDLTRDSFISARILRDSSPFQTFREAKNYSTNPRSAFSSQPLSNNNRSNPVGQTASTSTFSNIFTTSNTQPINNSFPRGAAPKNKTEKNNNVNVPLKTIEKLNVKVKGSTQWYDELDPKVPCYRTRSKKIALLINIKKFAKNVEEERKGSEIDESNLRSLFSQMGFKVESPRGKEWTKKEVESAISNFKSKGLKKYDVSIVVVMSHGSGGTRSDSTVISCSDNETIETNWIVAQFDGNNCADLLGKPKIFIFQCCRGKQEYLQRRVMTDGKASNAVISPHSDILIAYATAPGFVAYRYEDIGSWYIHTLCKIFMEHACDTHVEDLLKMVDEEMKTFSNHHKELTNPTTTYESRGFKKCYLHPKMS